MRWCRVMKLIINELSFGDSITYFFDEEKQLCFINEEQKSVDVIKTMQDLLNILCGAKTRMVNKQVLDGGRYDITILNGDKQRKYYFQNSYPKNFDKFIEILGGLKKC